MKSCERCGQSFGCQMGETDKSCWCVDMPPLSTIPAQYKDCLCPNCLREFQKRDASLEASAQLVEGDDFYYERGLMVFTTAYHLKRGHCCKSDCRHCPWT